MTGFLGSKSPSKLFEDVAISITQGWSQCITGNTGMVRNAALGMAGATLPTVNNWSLVINEAGNRGNIQADFAILRALAELS